jgi:hypothetical protein
MHLRGKTTLVHGERTQAVLSSVAVGLHDHLSRRVTDPEIQDFALLDQRVEGLHQLRDLGGVVPAVNIELCEVSLQDGDCGVKFRSYQIDVVRLESLQASLDGQVHALHTGPTKVALLNWSTVHSRGCTWSK